MMMELIFARTSRCLADQQEMIDNCRRTSGGGGGPIAGPAERPIKASGGC